MDGSFSTALYNIQIGDVVRVYDEKPSDNTVHVTDNLSFDTVDEGEWYFDGEIIDIVNGLIIVDFNDQIVFMSPENLCQEMTEFGNIVFVSKNTVH